MFWRDGRASLPMQEKGQLARELMALVARVRTEQGWRPGS